MDKMKVVLNFEAIMLLAPDVLKERMEKLKLNGERLDFHPEGNTFDHIKIVTDRLCDTGDINLIMGGFFHDLGKLETTKPHPKTGQPCAFGHEMVSGKIVLAHKEFIEKMGADADTVHEIVVNHMKIKQIEKMGARKQGLMRELKTFDKLEIFTRADSMLKEWDYERLSSDQD